MMIPFVVLIIAVLILGIIFCVQGFTDTHQMGETKAMDRLIIPLATMSVFGDIYIAVTLCYFVHTSRARVNKHSDSMMKLVMMYIINNGAITSLTSLACLLAFVFIAPTGVAFALYFLVSKLYVNCLLASLNARDFLRAKASQATISHALSSSIAFVSPSQTHSPVETETSGLRTPDENDERNHHHHHHHHFGWQGKGKELSSSTLSSPC